jgi:excisionase family DNA binding protein
MDRAKIVELLTISEAAERMHVSMQTIYTWMHEGRIKPVFTPGGRTRIPEDQLIIRKWEPTEGVSSNVFPIRDISDLYPDRGEQLGTKEKYWFWRTENHWYWYSDGQRFLFKAGREGTGDNWAEKIASELCRLLGLPHVEYDLAVYRDLKGVITPNFVPEGGARFEAGNEILELYIPEYDKTKRYKQTKHTLRDMLALLSNRFIQLPIGWSSLGGIKTSADVFVGYLMLDALIANQDRHHENWGVVVMPENKTVHLAPTFDHASSLGRNESDSSREERMNTRDIGRSVNQYVQRARSAFYNTPDDTKPLSTLEAFREAAKKRPAAARFWLNKLEAVSLSNTRLIIDRVPKEEMSDISKEFTQKIIDLNKQRLLSLRR